MAPQAEVTLAEANLRALFTGALSPTDLAGREGVQVAGDAAKLTELLGHLAASDPGFAIVTP